MAFPAFCCLGAERDRTVDLLTASQALSQLSYSPSKTDVRIVSTAPLGCQRQKPLAPSPVPLCTLVFQSAMVPEW
jgi:hypothetical protein